MKYVRYVLYICYFSALTITIKTSPEAVEVTFNYKDAKHVRQYEAYVDSSHKCSRPGDKPPYRCLVRDLEEAKEYVIYARVCLSGKAHCEPEVKENARTELRGKFLCFYLVLSWRRVFKITVYYFSTAWFENCASIADSAEPYNFANR